MFGLKHILQLVCFISSSSLRLPHFLMISHNEHIQMRSLPVFFGKPEGPFCLFCTFIFQNERNWMKKSARVSEKLVSPGLPGLQVATRLTSGYFLEKAFI